MFRWGMVLAAALVAAPAFAQSRPGVTATSIKIGQTQPYSGPASANSSNGTADQAFFQMLNDQGGINGRKIDFDSVDDAYAPPRTLEQTRKLVEEDSVAFFYRSMGTAPNMAVAKYLNDRKIPQLFIASGASNWNDPQNRPYSMGSTISYRAEAAIFARYALSVKPNAKMAALYQNDDLGKDFLAGLTNFLGPNTDKYLVAKASYEITDPTLDSQIVSLQASGADVLFVFGPQKAVSMSVRKVYDIGWHPLTFLPDISSSVGGSLKPAGIEKAVGVITGAFLKDPSDPQWADDPEIKAWNVWMDKYLPHMDKGESAPVFSTAWGNVLKGMIAACGNAVTRDCIMNQATHLTNVKVPMLLPGITISTTPTDYRAIKQLQLERFDGTRYVRFGDVITAE
jgi:ABC-type branched-subunit amino acid transport system substrate-binding protein